MSLETFNCEYEQRRGKDHINNVQPGPHRGTELFWGALGKYQIVVNI